MFDTNQFKYRDFHIIGDANQQFKPLDAIAQFKYKEYMISMSTSGLSAGACQSEVQVFDRHENIVHRPGFHTVEEAIDFINTL
jgi:hypothetical protein